MQSVAELLQPLGGTRKRRRGQFSGLAKADDVWDVFRPRPPAALVTGAMNERLERHPPADIKRSDAFRGIELVPCDGQKIDAEFADVDRHLAERLRAVRMH